MFDIFALFVGNRGKMGNQWKNGRKSIHMQQLKRLFNEKPYQNERDDSRLKKIKKPNEESSNENYMTSNIKYYSPRDRVLNYVKNHRSDAFNTQGDNVLDEVYPTIQSNREEIIQGKDYSEKNTVENHKYPNEINSEYQYLENEIKLPVEIESNVDGLYDLTISKRVLQDIIRTECPRCLTRKRSAISTTSKNNTSIDDGIKDSARKSL